MEHIKQKITNPLTLIAIFATLSETSAAVSLPFLDDEDRDIYVWFLISFPFYLLFLFFATLNFNYRSLYAPSDFENGEHFIKAMSKTEHPGKRESRTTHKNPARSQSTIDRGSTPPPITHRTHVGRIYRPRRSITSACRSASKTCTSSIFAG